VEPEIRQLEPQQLRRFARVPFAVPVRLVLHGSDQSVDLMAVNLSENGIFVESVIPFVNGQLFQLILPTRPGGFSRVAAARVVWRRPYTGRRTPGLPAGTGLAFLLMRPEDRAALTELVESGGVAPTAQAPSRPRVVVHELPAPPRLAPVDPRLGSSLTQAFDPTPFGWLLAVALALAALANLVGGLSHV